jgi:HEXXH motif-containing protein
MDRAFHADLAGSLDHIAEAVKGPLPELARLLSGPRELLAAGQFLPPEAFGLYFQIAESVMEDLHDDAISAARLLATIKPRGTGIGHAARGNAGLIDHVLDLRMGEGAAGFHPIAPEVAEEFRVLVDQGLALLARGVPDLAAEITGILSQMIFAQAPPGAVMEFDGASHYQFWGLLLLNPRHHRTPLAVAEVLAHETAHSLLFGLTLDETLVRNPDDQLFKSPLRLDPRPMDGIFHATFVSARMAYAMERLANSGVLSTAEAEQARAAAAKDRENFAAGLGVVREHGDLTRTGAEVMANAQEWVETGATAMDGAGLQTVP